MASTCNSLEGILKTTWTQNRMLQNMYQENAFDRMIRMEMDDAARDMQRQMNRQYTMGNYSLVPVRVKPASVRAQMEITKQAIAKAKRGGKPSYRQRQRNARNARNARKGIKLESTSYRGGGLMSKR